MTSCNIVQTKSVADIFVQAVLCSTGFIVSIVETAGKLVAIAVEECRLRNVEEAST